MAVNLFLPRPPTGALGLVSTRALEERAARILYSTELDEIVGICDRALVLYNGAVAADLPRERLSQDRIHSLASGASARHEAA